MDSFSFVPRGPAAAASILVLVLDPVSLLGIYSFLASLVVNSHSFLFPDSKQRAPKESRTEHQQENKKRKEVVNSFFAFCSKSVNRLEQVFLGRVPSVR